MLAVMGVAATSTPLVPSLDDLGVDQGVARHSFVIAGPRPPMALICTGVGDRLSV